ncbi:MAG: 16S rRNA (adenine(1518)-N(6)/adenine(1519)-N(6))-dimethyltransferase RsmA [Armatimonadota bacterium]
MTDQPAIRPNPTSRSQLRGLFRSTGFRPRRERGQTFLVDENVARKVVRAADLQGTDPVLEIGPGAGAVTRLLAAESRRLVAIEIEPVLVGILGQTLGAGAQLVLADFLKVDLGQLLSSEPPGAWKCVANLPYAITGPAILRLLEQAHWFERLVLMVQQEVADRLLAPAGNRSRGLLTVLAEASCSVSSAGTVSRHCFYPQPKVDSAILVLLVRRPPLVPSELQGAFRSVVKAAFSSRRKTLANSLSGPTGLGLDKQAAARLLTDAQIEPARRAESLTVQEFLRLAEQFVPVRGGAEA